MKLRRIRTSNALLGAATLAISLALGAVSTAAQDKEPIRIGALLPMTGVGAPSGVSATIGIEMAVDDINTAGGIMGRKLVVVPADDQGDPTQAVVGARRLMQNDDVDFVLGPNYSQNALAIAPIATETDTLYISVAGSLQLTPEAAPLHFSMQASADGQGVAMVDYAASKGAKKIAVLLDNAANSKTMGARIHSRAKELGIEIVGEQEFAFASKDMTGQLLNLRGTNPEMLLLSGITGIDVGHALLGVEDLGWDIPIVGSLTFGADYPSVLKVAGPDILKQAVGLDIRAFSYCADTPIGETPAAKLLAKLKQKVGAEKFDSVSTGVVIYMYDAVHVAKAAIEATGSTDGTALKDWIEANADKIPVTLGQLTASKDNHFLSGGAEANAIIEDLTSVREDGLRKRAGC